MESLRLESLIYFSDDQTNTLLINFFDEQNVIKLSKPTSIQNFSQSTQCYIDILMKNLKKETKTLTHSNTEYCIGEHEPQEL